MRILIGALAAVAVLSGCGGGGGGHPDFDFAGTWTWTQGGTATLALLPDFTGTLTTAPSNGPTCGTLPVTWTAHEALVDLAIGGGPATTYTTLEATGPDEIGGLMLFCGYDVPMTLTRTGTDLAMEPTPPVTILIYDERGNRIGVGRAR